MDELANRVVVITGAGGGLGRAMCGAFLAAGARVAALDLEHEGFRELVAAHADNPGFAAWPCDVTDAAACESAVGAVRERYGMLDVLVNNAGITHRSAVRDTDVAVLRRVMEVNFFGAVLITRAALADLEASTGRIVVISSVAGFAPLIARSGYSASKHALHGFFESLRGEEEEHGVTVTMVCPAFIATDIEKNALGRDGGRVSHVYRTVGGRMRPEQVAARIVRAAARRERLCVIGSVGRASWWVRKLAPAFYERQMVRRLRGEMGGDS